MALTTTVITRLILSELATAEMRVLALTVAVRKGLGESVGVKGDLPAAVRSVLRKLVSTHAIADVDGVYSLVDPATPVERAVRSPAPTAMPRNPALALRSRRPRTRAVGN